MHEQVYQCPNAHDYQHAFKNTLNAKMNNKNRKHARDEWVK